MFSKIRSKISKPKITAANKNAKKSESSKVLVNEKNDDNCKKSNSKKTVSLSDLKPCVKAPEFDNPRILRRSDTFTVDDDDYPIENTICPATDESLAKYDNPNYKTYTRKKEKGKKIFWFAVFSFFVLIFGICNVSSV